MNNPDIRLEEKWKELTDIPFDETDGDLVLSRDWWLFTKGTKQEEIWRYFDEHHTKGIYYLLYEYK